MELNKLISEFNEKTDIYSKENLYKAKCLEKNKSSLKTPIIYFLEEELQNIPQGYSKSKLEDIKAKVLIEKRSLLEYLPSQRHPIPYCVVKCKDKYFLIFREQGSGEQRLIGKKGLLGGHIDDIDVVYNENKEIDLDLTVKNGLYRELKEEADIKEDLIKDISLIGMIKIQEKGTVENDHLGLVYQIEVSNDKFKTIEDGVLSGDWFTKEEIIQMKSSLERWAYLIFDNML